MIKGKKIISKASDKKEARPAKQPPKKEIDMEKSKEPAEKKEAVMGTHHTKIQTAEGWKRSMIKARTPQKKQR